MKRIIQLLSLCVLVWACSKPATSPKDEIAGCSSETQNQECGSVAGSVVGSDGKPVEGATVEAFLKAGTVLKKASAAMARDSSAGTAKTDANGKYLIDGLLGADYTLKVVKDDSLGAALEFSLGKGEDKTLAPITIINNGIIIGQVDRSIVQQAENAYAVINEIGQQTLITKQGDYTFNNVPVYNNYTITIYTGEKADQPVPSSLDKATVEVQAGKVTRVDTAGTPTYVPRGEVQSGPDIKVASKTLADAAASLPGGASWPWWSTTRRIPFALKPESKRARNPVCVGPRAAARR